MTASEILVVFDPGKTTGYAIFVGNDLVECGSFPLWDRVHELLDHGAGPMPRVVYENVHANTKAFDDSGIQVIGVIRYVCQLIGITPKQQSPVNLQGARKHYTLDIVGDRHARDAIWHGAVALKLRPGTLRVLLPEVKEALI